MEDHHLFSSPLASSDIKGKHFRGLKNEAKSHNKQNMTQKYHNYAFLTKVVDEVLQNLTLVFSVEETLLKSSTSLFPYFMLVAFEGGRLGLLRALILLLLYPLICLVGEEIGLKIMVFVCFFGVKRDTFRVGTSVLPKFFLEDVGYEGFSVVKRFGRRVGVSNLPRVMVEGFLKHYLGVEDIVGREIRVFGGYYLGVMEDEHKLMGGKDLGLKDMFSGVYSQVVGIAGTLKSFQTYPFTCCQDLYLVSEADKKKWHSLPRDEYPTPLIFHDGRLAFKPTPLATFVMLVWLPFGIILSIIRIFIGILFPYCISTPILAFIGISYCSSNHPASSNKQDRESENSKGIVFVCNHRTVIDPLYVSYICRMHLSALTYSISRVTEFLAPIRTITLTRDRQKDAEIMQKVLSKGNIVVCPEGTTCREPYLLRFSPLFAEISEKIIPVALHATVSMFYGTTASGIKALDPFFLMMNPWPYYHVKFLDKLPKAWTCKAGGVSKFDVANHVQAEIGEALGYKCTNLTRKDKYLMLAGNIGIVSKPNK
uniref:Glycerol-3-phosphate 1-O-acyltransferase n=1 Tax=Opuntia streptacantha TaxID=393608 RepID=A0A7C9EPM0_OPUST